MCEYDDYDYDYCERNYEANRLINRVILRGQDALDDFVGPHLTGESGPDPLDAMIVAEHAARKLCRHRERFSHDCPAINGLAEDVWCPMCVVAGQLAFASGLLGVLWREQLGSDGQVP
jgi:hypothetical protein